MVGLYRRQLNTAAWELIQKLMDEIAPGCTRASFPRAQNLTLWSDPRYVKITHDPSFYQDVTDEPVAAVCNRCGEPFTWTNGGLEITHLTNEAEYQRREDEYRRRAD